MISRYEDPGIRAIFSDENRIHLWVGLEIDYLSARAATGDQLVTRKVLEEIVNTPDPSQIDVAHIETKLGHDVVAFLSAWTRKMTPPAASQVHYGLTSSDLVDNALFSQMHSAGERIVELADTLTVLVAGMAEAFKDTMRAGRTHGQYAETTTLGWRFSVWKATLEDLVDEWPILVRSSVKAFKTPGAVGDMRIIGKDVALWVAEARECVLVPSTQVIPRQRMMVWASWCLRLVSVVEEIAMEIRLSSRSEVQEVMEGAARNRAGSSAMPHKRNPVGSEQLSGLGRVARAYFSGLAESAGALHNERDISNSSVERLLVPDLAHLTAYSLSKVVGLLDRLVVDEVKMAENAGKVPSSSTQLAILQRRGIAYMSAREILKDS